MKTILMFILIAMSAFMIFVISSMSHQDAKMEEAYYTEMVCAGAWPDYRGVVFECD